MTSASLPLPVRFPPVPFSVVTLSNRDGPPPGWRALFDWPASGDSHVAYAPGSDAQRNLWATRLDAAVAQADRAVLLVADGASCFAAAWWAKLSPTPYVAKVAGALLFRPLDAEPDEIETRARRFAAPRVVLPFPSIVIDDAVAPSHLDAGLQTLAAGWGSSLVDGAAARPRFRSGHSRWRGAHRMLMQMTAGVVERELRIAEAFGVRWTD